jgi:hypothetical protein
VVPGALLFAAETAVRYNSGGRTRFYELFQGRGGTTGEVGVRVLSWLPGHLETPSFGGGNERLPFEDDKQ